ncbi:hypothetical protein [Pilimelia columellifera]|uniref:Uncharacterized protein n=1 Tax=Pilimelia columellifera subsp. columellifera TaxID=706583 RepID=A0ABN3N026_9ACTN
MRYRSVSVFFVLVWLLIGLLAAGQRGYLRSADATCAEASTIAVTVLAGPLNYVGLNPVMKCELPQPSS